MTGKKLDFGTFKTSLFTIGAVAAMLLTACAGFEALETPEEPAANNTTSKPANDSAAVAAKKAMAYSPMQITYLKPEEILPIVGQIESGDKKAYQHIEHLGIAEATKIRDMMWNFGAGNHSAEEYQELMMRLNTGMVSETPKGFNNFETIGGGGKPSTHAQTERYILNALIKHANFKVLNSQSGTGWYEYMLSMCKGDPDKINIFGRSMNAGVGKEEYGGGWREGIRKMKEYSKEKNRLLFGSGGNVVEEKEDGERILKNKIYQEDVDLTDIHSVYDADSYSHGKNDTKLDMHNMITVGTNKNGDVTIKDSGSKFPVGFHDKVLFSGHTFPHTNDEYVGHISAESGKYATSFTNYLNVAMADLCFQMFAEVKDVDELLDMMRSTALTDYVRMDLNGDGDTEDVVRMAGNEEGFYVDQPESQPLQLINPAGFFREYNLPENLPEEIKTSEMLQLGKGYYKGVIFSIPGAEVLVGGEWIPFDSENADLIKSQNPFTLEWRLNGERLWQLGYADKTIEGTIITVDDQWKGLNHLTKTFTVNVIKDISTSIKPVYQ